MNKEMTRDSLKIQEDMFKERKRKLQVRGNKSAQELIEWANNPKNYRR